MATNIDLNSFVKKWRRETARFNEEYPDIITSTENFRHVFKIDGANPQAGVMYLNKHAVFFIRWLHEVITRSEIEDKFHNVLITANREGVIVARDLLKNNIHHFRAEGFSNANISYLWEIITTLDNILDKDILSISYIAAEISPYIRQLSESHELIHAWNIWLEETTGQLHVPDAWVVKQEGYGKAHAWLTSHDCPDNPEAIGKEWIAYSLTDEVDHGGRSRMGFNRRQMKVFNERYIKYIGMNYGSVPLERLGRISSDARAIVDRQLQDLEDNRRANEQDERRKTQTKTKSSPKFWKINIGEEPVYRLRTDRGSIDRRIQERLWSDQTGGFEARTDDVSGESKQIVTITPDGASIGTPTSRFAANISQREQSEGMPVSTPLTENNGSQIELIDKVIKTSNQGQGQSDVREMMILNTLQVLIRQARYTNSAADWADMKDKGLVYAFSRETAGPATYNHSKVSAYYSTESKSLSFPTLTGEQVYVKVGAIRSHLDVGDIQTVDGQYPTRNIILDWTKRNEEAVTRSSSGEIAKDCIAVHSETNEIIAQGKDLRDLDERIGKTGIWDRAPGTVAPYFITSLGLRDYLGAWYREGFSSRPHQIGYELPPDHAPYDEYSSAEAFEKNVPRVPFIEAALAAGANIEYALFQINMKWTVVSFEKADGLFLIIDDKVYVTQKNLSSVLEAIANYGQLSIQKINDLKLVSGVQIEVPDIPFSRILAAMEDHMNKNILQDALRNGARVDSFWSDWHGEKQGHCTKLLVSFEHDPGTYIFNNGGRYKTDLEFSETCYAMTFGNEIRITTTDIIIGTEQNAKHEIEMSPRGTDRHGYCQGEIM